MPRTSITRNTRFTRPRRVPTREPSRPADRIQDGVKDGGHDPPSHLGDRQYQALVGVESCELGFRCCKDGDQHEPGEVCQNTHDLVLFNIRFVKISGGVSSVVQSAIFAEKSF